MGRIGNFGKEIVFEVNANKILTPNGIKRTVGGRWENHNVVGEKPKMEFIGADTDETTMTVVLSAEHGVRPRATMEKLERAVEKGTVEYLVIGGKVVGKNKMFLKSISEEWDCVWSKGEVVKATMELVFEEYT